MTDDGGAAVARARRPLIRSSVPPASDLHSPPANTGWHRCACGQRVQPAAKTPVTCGEISRRARFHIGLAAAQREAAAEGAETLNWLGIGSFPISFSCPLAEGLQRQKTS